MAQLDWLLLLDNKENAFECLKELLERGHANARFLPDAVQEKILWSFYWEQRSAQRLMGQQVLYFQYPFFTKEEEKKEVIQPLLRWPIQLTPPIHGSGHWTINIKGNVSSDVSYALNAEVAYNNKWCDWANEQFPYDWKKALEACFDAKGQGLKALSNLAQAMIEKTDWFISTLHPELSQQYEKNDDNKNELLWKASIGFNKENWGQSVLESAVDWKATKEQETIFVDQLNLLQLDPYQYQALKKGNSKRFVPVAGRQGSGKTHTVIEGIKVNLLNEKPCLIVAREKASLVAIQRKLKKAQLGDLVFHWHNEATDFAVFQAKIQTSSKMNGAISKKEQAEWSAALGKQNRVQRSLAELFAASRKRVVENNTWLELLGAYLQVARIEGKELLASQLSAAYFQFTTEEYRGIKASIEKTKPLFKALGNTHHPLANLNAAIFIHQSLDESKVFIQQTSKKFLGTAKSLHQQYIRLQSQYADQLASYHEAYYIELRQQLQQLLALVEDGQNEFGEDVLASSETSLKLRGQFSMHFKRAIQQRSEIIEAYDELQASHEKMVAFNFDWLTGKAKKIVPQLMAFLVKYESKLQQWRTTFTSKINDELIRLNHKTALDSIDISATIEPLEEELEIFIDEVNASGLYQLPLHSKTLTLTKQQKYLEEIIGQLERSRSGLLDYDTFYDWQRNWFSLTETTRKTIQALLRALPDDWTAAFSSWYLNECLSRGYRPFPIISETAMVEYAEKINPIRFRLSDVIHAQWVTRHQIALAKLKSLVKSKPASVKLLLENGGSHVASVYPIALACPEMAQLLAPFYKVIYLDNAQNLTTDTIVAMAQKGDQLMAFFNNDEAGFEKNGIVSLCKKNELETINLRNSYQLNFAQQALALGDNIAFHAVKGRFNEEDQTNEVEAFEVLKILNSIKKTPQQTYPSVGIVCMTTGQRNKILELLYRIKKNRHTGVEIIQQLERNGLKVMTGAELIGQHFDQVIFSAVHGPIDSKGHLSAALNELNKGEQMATLSALKGLMTSYTKWGVLSSLPQEELKIRSFWSDKKGEQYFGKLLELFSCIAEGDFDTAFLLSKFWEKEKPLKKNRTLAGELKYRISEQLPAWKFELSREEQIEYSYLKALAPNGSKIVLLADDFLAESAYTTIDWEYDQQQRLELAGYQLLSFSTEALWKNPIQSCLELVSKLKDLADNHQEEE